MTSPNQLEIEYDQATMMRCLETVEKPRIRRVLQGLLLTAIEEPQSVVCMDADGCVGCIGMIARMSDVASRAKASHECIRKNVVELKALCTPVIEKTDTGNQPSEWWIYLGRVMDETTVQTVMELIEHAKILRRKLPPTFEKLGATLPPTLPPTLQKNETLSSCSMKHAKHANKTHAKHESLKSSDSETQPSRPKSGGVKFNSIPAEHIRRIVKARDLELFDRYFRDVVKAGWARTDDSGRDRHRLAALFHQVVRINEAAVPGSVIYSGWKSRDAIGEDENGKPRGLTLADEDEDFASELLRVRSDPARSAAAQVIFKPVSGELTPEQLREQEVRRQGMLRQAKVMQQNDAGK